jgi:ubiquinone/menaquinone biosynthesis C-methylase UbiE/uncharacterized protein YbaR (Trm112 family)
VKKQLVDNQRGEIAFREKLVQQQVGGKPILDDEQDAEGIEKMLDDRMKKTFNRMTALREDGVAISPYAEIGAERCQRALVMENDLGATGAAIDISYHMLRSCDHYKEVFDKDKVPLRICCDANSLPFRTDSVPFVFCYETLHHFPDPTPITREIYRVVSPGGHFLFDEEPYKRILHINLYKRNRVNPKESLRRAKLRKIFDYFLSKETSNEIEHNIIENNDISLRIWKQALSLFEWKRVELQSMKVINSELFKPRQYTKFLLAGLFGGGISGICRKSGVSTKRDVYIRDLLVCPSCIENGCESKINQRNVSFSCSRCGSEFPIVDGVAFLFSRNKLKELYPGISQQLGD